MSTTWAAKHWQKILFTLRREEESLEEGALFSDQHPPPFPLTPFLGSLLPAGGGDLYPGCSCLTASRGHCDRVPVYLFIYFLPLAAASEWGGSSQHYICLSSGAFTAGRKITVFADDNAIN